MAHPHDPTEPFLNPFFGIDVASCLRERAAMPGDRPFFILGPF